MKNEMDRRTVLKLGGLGLLACFSYPASSAFSSDGSPATFVIDESPKKGCAYCGRIMRKILADKKKKAKLASFFPDGAEVTIYMKVQPRNKKMGEHSLSLGNCSRAIKGKTLAHVPGCGSKKITVDYVYTTMVKKLEAKSPK